MEEIIGKILELSLFYHYAIVFIVLLCCGLGVPIPEDITLIAAGALCYYGDASVIGMIGVGMIGVLLGDSIIFFLGKKYGERLTQVWPFRKFLNADRMKWAEWQLSNKGGKLIFAARFMPGFRAPVYFTSGTLKYPFRQFLFLDGAAALLSVPAIVGLAYYFGDELDRIIQLIRNTEHGILAVILMTALFFGLKWYIGKRKSAKAKG